MDAWIPITIAAAFFQNLRSALQKHIRGRLSTAGAGYARFVYAWPFALIYVCGPNALGGMAWPSPSWLFLASIAAYRSRPNVIALIMGNLLFNVLANTGFKLSADSATWRGFLAWQVVGNLSGFVAVLNLTGAMRFIPLHVAYPISAGLTVIAVQLFAARLLLHEAVTPVQWLGTLLVVIGIVLIGGR